MGSASLLHVHMYTYLIISSIAKLGNQDSRHPPQEWNPTEQQNQLWNDKKHILNSQHINSKYSPELYAVCIVYVAVKF